MHTEPVDLDVQACRLPIFSDDIPIDRICIKRPLQLAGTVVAHLTEQRTVFVIASLIPSSKGWPSRYSSVSGASTLLTLVVIPVLYYYATGRPWELRQAETKTENRHDIPDVNIQVC
ncbi:MAG: hypothetical protein A4E19_04660 [Nitrospira sp. SG-bin1]|nr:MAG: hypothetical protein A4E19_04660 [Nitrospira sp. SG-bin1]